MNPIIYLYNEILYRPLFNGLVWLYTALPWQDIGLAIIVLTIISRLILAPILIRAQSAQKKLASLQPEIKKIQDGHRGNKEGQGKALMELYGKHKVNPFSGCLMMLVQLPILIALFQVFQKGFDPGQLAYLYSFVQNPGSLNPVSFGLADLSKGNLYLGAVAALTQYFQTKLSSPAVQAGAGPGDFNKILQWQTSYVFPVLILVWSYTLPSALTLYWTVLNLFAILQEIVVSKLKAKG